MTTGLFPQVLLFAGPKGTGKTSTSRIIGALLNDPRNEPGKAFQEPDDSDPLLSSIFEGTSYVVQEMDAASNRGIDDVRSLKEKVQLSPQQGRVTVYILDEAHMLTTEASNALLKLLEEPPSHAVFILATTELHKIPPTIVSRAHVIHFHQASQSELVAALERVLTAEHITYEPEALALIAQSADGSFRDAIKVAQVVSQAGDVVVERVTQFSISSLEAEMRELLSALLAKDSLSLLKLFEEIRARAIDERFFHRRLLEFLHLTLLQTLGLKEGAPVCNGSVAQFLLKELSTIPTQVASPIPHLVLELKLLELIERSAKKSSSGGGGGGSGKDNAGPAHTSSLSESKSTAASSTLMVTDVIPTQLTTHQPHQQEPEVHQHSTVSDVLGDGAVLCREWTEFISLVSQKNVTVGALLRSAQPRKGQLGSVEVSVFYTFHQEQLMQPKIAAILSDCIRMLTGGSVKIQFVLENPPAAAELVTTPSAQALSAVVSQVLM